jgi:hypothetical protein
MSVADEERRRITVALDVLLAIVAIAIQVEQRAPAQLAPREPTPPREPTQIHNDWLRWAS